MLDQVGKELVLNNLDGYGTIRAKIIMVIKAPRGECRIFEQPLYRGYLSQSSLHKQCRAIRSFMEQHNPMLSR